MANMFYPEPIIGSDNGVWGAKELRQNRATMGLCTAQLYNDAGSLKISTGIIGLNDGSLNGIIDIDTVSTLDFSGVTSGYWFTIEVSRTNITPVFTCTRIESATSQSVSPYLDTYYDGRKVGYYITATKRLIGVAWKTGGGALESVFNLLADNRQPGTIDICSGSTIPPGWLLCNGTAISRTTYKNLFGRLGTTWGAGDTTTTFNLPDLRGAAPAGVGTSTGYTQNETIAIATKYNDQFQGHTMGRNNGTVRYGSSVNNGFAAGSNSIPWSSVAVQVGDDYLISDGTNGTPRTGLITRGKLVGVNFIIKY